VTGGAPDRARLHRTFGAPARVPPTVSDLASASASLSDAPDDAPRWAPAPQPAADAVPHNVPGALSSFVGRTGERADLAVALAAERLVTVTGPGGAGKTRLAREVAADAVAAVGGAGLDGPRYPGGVWWVELAPLATGADVAPAVAAVLGVRAAPGRDVAEAVAEALGGTGHPRSALLVLDNCEHVIEAAAAFVERLLRAAPALTVLATSREALAVEGEQAWVLPPLASPPASRAAAPATAASLTGYEAVRLFVERARAATPAFALPDRTAPAVAAVCARLDGLPLALELAAASVGALGVDQVAARLGDVFGLLTRGRRTALPRHKTLRALLDWSYALLGAEERRLLARLGVFRGPFTLDAAEAVGAGGPGDPVPDGAAAVRALGRLVEQSLVDVREQDGETRYRLLETVRQYGLARLAEDPAHAARARHAAWCVAGRAAVRAAQRAHLPCLRAAHPSRAGRWLLLRRQQRRGHVDRPRRRDGPLAASGRRARGGARGPRCAGSRTGDVSGMGWVSRCRPACPWARARRARRCRRRRAACSRASWARRWTRCTASRGSGIRRRGRGGSGRASR